MNPITSKYIRLIRASIKKHPYSDLQIVNIVNRFLEFYNDPTVAGTITKALLTNQPENIPQNIAEVFFTWLHLVNISNPHFTVGLSENKTTGSLHVPFYIALITNQEGQYIAAVQFRLDRRIFLGMLEHSIKEKLEAQKVSITNFTHLHQPFTIAATITYADNMKEEEFFIKYLHLH